MGQQDNNEHERGEEAAEPVDAGQQFLQVGEQREPQPQRSQGDAGAAAGLRDAVYPTAGLQRRRLRPDQDPAAQGPAGGLPPAAPRPPGAAAGPDHLQAGRGRNQQVPGRLGPGGADTPRGAQADRAAAGRPAGERAAAAGGEGSQGAYSRCEVLRGRPGAAAAPGETHPGQELQGGGAGEGGAAGAGAGGGGAVGGEGAGGAGAEGAGAGEEAGGRAAGAEGEAGSRLQREDQGARPQVRNTAEEEPQTQSGLRQALQGESAQSQRAAQPHHAQSESILQLSTNSTTALPQIREFYSCRTAGSRVLTLGGSQPFVPSEDRLPVLLPIMWQKFYLCQIITFLRRPVGTSWRSPMRCSKRTCGRYNKIGVFANNYILFHRNFTLPPTSQLNPPNWNRPPPKPHPQIMQLWTLFQQYQTFLPRVGVITHLIRMEDQWNKLPPTADEEEDTLLSHKLKALPSPHLTTLISSLSAPQLPFPPLQQLKPLFRTTCATLVPAAPSPDPALAPLPRQEKFRSNSSSIKRRTAYDLPHPAPDPPQSGSPPGQPITYKFMKVATNERRKWRSIYEETVGSVGDINGSGYLLLSDGRVMEGSWEEGVPRGCLKIKFPSGLIYYGPVYNYRQHGYGYLYFADGERYEGEFCYGEFHGEGVYYDRAGAVKRKGEWKRGKFIG